jgi:hypothetical protein
MRLTLIVVAGALLAAIAVGLSSFNANPTPMRGVWSPEHGHYH